MPKPNEKKNQRRWERDAKEKPWTEDQRKQFHEHAELIGPVVRHLTTPAVKEEPEKPPDIWDMFRKPKKEVTQ